MMATDQNNSKEDGATVVVSENINLEKGNYHIQRNNDDELLAQLGYKAELKRNFSVIEVFGIAFSIMSLMPSIASSISFSLNGGPVGLTWGWLVPSFFILSVGIALSELGSALPTSGGLYWWTYRFAPNKVKKPLCFLVGYSNTLGLIGGTCSITHGWASLIMSLPGITNESFTPDRFQTYAVFVGGLICFGIVGSIATPIVARLQAFCIFLNIVAILITVIALPIGANKIQTGEYVFTHVENYSEWPKGWTFVMTWMSAIWTINSFDSCIHMAEEASNASVAVPLGIVSSIAICGVLGFAILAVIAACIPDYDAVLNTAFGNPMTQIYYNVLGKEWAIGITALLAVVQWFMGLSIVIAASRQTWAFSRDGALPFSKILRVLNGKLEVPVRAVWFVCIVSGVIGLLSLVGDAATNALFSLGVASNGLAWAVPIFCRAVWFDKDDFTPGPFYLGHFFSRANAFFASIYLIFAICVLGMVPQDGPNVTPSTMNYTCVFNGVVWGGCLIYYAVDARKWFKGPRSTLSEEAIESAEKSGGDVLHHHHHDISGTERHL